MFSGESETIHNTLPHLNIYYQNKNCNKKEFHANIHTLPIALLLSLFLPF